MSRAARHEGFALVSALFLLVVLAGLGAAAVRLNGVQQHSVSLSLQAARAFAAAQSGIDYAAHRALAGGACASQTLTLTEAGLAGFSVTVDCSSTAHAEAGATTTVYTLQAFAWSGLYGGPDYVSRRLHVTVTDSP